MNTIDNGKYIFFASDLEKESFELYSINSDGTNLKRLTYHKTEVWPYNVFISPNDNYLAYSCIDLAGNKKGSGDKAIWLLNIQNDSQTQIHSNYNGRPGAISDEGILNCWSKDNKYLGMTIETNEYLKGVLYDLESKKFIWFGKNNYYDEVFGLITSDSKYLITVCYDGAITKSIKYFLETGEELLSFNHYGVLFPVGMLSDPNQVIFQSESSIFSAKLVNVNIHSLEMKEFLIEDNYSIKENFFHPSKYISIKSLDGSIFYALFYIPKDFDPTKKYPAIIQVHGGPTTHYSDNFYAEVQCLVDQGFVLLLPNVRGSTGYGIQFQNACLHDWAGKDLEDIIGCRNFLSSLNYIDNTRIGVLGESYGGYLVYNALVKFPHYWSTAVIISAWADLFSLYRYYEKKFYPALLWMESQMGKPEKNPNLWFDRSPINFFPHIKAKLFIIHGENNSSIPLNEAVLVKNTLENIQYKNFRLETLRDAGHASFKY